MKWNLSGFRHPIEWWRDWRDPLRDLEPIELDLPDSAEDEMSTDLRDYLHEIAAADARGGIDEVFATIEKRGARKRDDARFSREGTMLAIARAALAVSALGLVVSIVALVVAANAG